MTLDDLGNIGEVVAALADLESRLEPDERRRFAAYLLGMFRRFENMVYQTRLGAIGAGAWEGVKKIAQFTLSRPGATAWWQQGSELFTEEFRDYVERELLPKR